MAMKKCPECGAEISSKAESCPHCGAKQKGNKPFYKRPWFIILAVLVIFSGITSIGETRSAVTSSSSKTSVASSSVAASSKTAKTTPTATPAASEPKKDFEIKGDITVERDSFTTYFSGVVVNNKNRDLSYAQITFNLYDADGNLVGTALDNINNLKAGGSWKFKAMAFCDNEEISSWEVAEITGY